MATTNTPTVTVDGGGGGVNKLTKPTILPSKEDIKSGYRSKWFQSCLICELKG